MSADKDVSSCLPPVLSLVGDDLSRIHCVAVSFCPMFVQVAVIHTLLICRRIIPVLCSPVNCDAC